MSGFVNFKSVFCVQLHKDEMSSVQDRPEQEERAYKVSERKPEGTKLIL
jgi:hypothetical protein